MRERKKEMEGEGGREGGRMSKKGRRSELILIRDKLCICVDIYFTYIISSLHIAKKKQLFKFSVIYRILHKACPQNIPIQKHRKGSKHRPSSLHR